jgi:hypothetical protein
LPTLGEGGGRQPGPDGGAELLDATGHRAEFQPLLGQGVQLALLAQQRRLAPVQLLPLALELGEPEHLGQVGIQQPLLLARELVKSLTDGSLAGVEFLRQPRPSPCSLQGLDHLGWVGQ